VLAVNAGRLGQRQQQWAAVLSAGEGAVLAGLAAAQASGLRFTSRRLIIDVLVPARRRVVSKPLAIDMPVVRIHPADLTRSDIQRGRPDLTPMARSIVDAARWALSDEEARQIVAAACQQKRVDPAAITEMATRLTRLHRRAVILETAAFATGGATTLSEIGFVQLCRRHMLPSPRMQEPRKDASGRHRYLDAYFADYHLHVEIDGGYHREARQWTADMLRQNEVWLQGDRVLRFPAHLIQTNPGLVIAQVRTALIAAGWKPRS
jgi:very-short-patch-repair endonuclease